MKRLLKVLLISVCCLISASCGSSDEHIGEAKTPSGSEAMKGRDYESVLNEFEEHGFTNVKLEKIEDLVFGWLTKDGEVEEVSVGGDVNYSADKWVAADIEVIIKYHTFPEQQQQVAETETEFASENIVIPYSTSDYIGSEWTIETITAHFKELGFTNICAEPRKPDDDDYKMNIFRMSISTGKKDVKEWNAGDSFAPDAEITIYYNEFPILTIDNCEDLASILTSKDMDYMEFCNQYDGRYVEFEAYVLEHIIYDGGTSHIIDVAGGDYNGQTEISSYKPETYSGHCIRVGDYIGYDSIDTSVEIGDHVTVSGRISARWAEYYKHVYVETLDMSRR
ncbi:MAG: hypothetical protein IKU29_02910 [Parabacteroides sp.]|nr:hypothetical protein [Parabacteroides sp.]